MGWREEARARAAEERREVEDAAQREAEARRAAAEHQRMLDAWYAAPQARPEQVELATFLTSHRIPATRLYRKGFARWVRGWEVRKPVQGHYPFNGEGEISHGSPGLALGENGILYSGWGARWGVAHWDERISHDEKVRLATLAYKGTDGRAVAG